MNFNLLPDPVAIIAHDHAVGNHHVRHCFFTLVAEGRIAPAVQKAELRPANTSTARDYWF